MEKIMAFLQLLDKWILNVLKGITIIAFTLITLLLAATILGRYLHISFLWSEEIIEILFAYMVFYGAAALWISKGHFSAGNWISDKILKKESGRHVYRLALELMILVFVVIFFYFSLQLTLFAASVTNVLAIPKRVFYSCMPVSGAIMIIYSLRNIIAEICALQQARQSGKPESQGGSVPTVR